MYNRPSFRPETPSFGSSTISKLMLTQTQNMLLVKHGSDLKNAAAERIKLQPEAHLRSGGCELSSCLADLDGQQYLIWLTPYNSTPRNRTFTVSAISDDIVPNPHSEGERSINPPLLDLHLRNHLLLYMRSGDEPPNIGKLTHQYH
ncbi:Uncharacterized protein Rs2_29362 [Raphanus sativus]|nr:Uncharacterized protein Rs2_29362 [Raphanus sativus]